MAVHAEYSLGRTSIAQVLNLFLAVSTPEALSAERLVTRQNSQVLYLVATGIAAVRAVAANQGAVAQEEEVRVRVEKGSASAASETIDVPSLSSLRGVSTAICCCKSHENIQSSKAFPSSRMSPQPMHG